MTHLPLPPDPQDFNLTETQPAQVPRKRIKERNRIRQLLRAAILLENLRAKTIKDQEQE